MGFLCLVVLCYSSIFYYTLILTNPASTRVRAGRLVDFVLFCFVSHGKIIVLYYLMILETDASRNTIVFKPWGKLSLSSQKQKRVVLRSTWSLVVSSVSRLQDCRLYHTQKKEQRPLMKGEADSTGGKLSPGVHSTGLQQTSDSGCLVDFPRSLAS